jgi:hypothetical protein
MNEERLYEKAFILKGRQKYPFFKIPKKTGRRIFCNRIFRKGKRECEYFLCSRVKKIFNGRFDIETAYLELFNSFAFVEVSYSNNFII